MPHEIHPSNSRGSANYGWLQTHYSFSFADYYNPARMGFGALRVLNDDYIEAGRGFGMHPHQDMEIITIPLSGVLAHKDSMGYETEIRAGEVQMMSAGTGIRHSEINPSLVDPCTLLQIWISPRAQGLSPRYQQKALVPPEQGSVIVASPQGEGGSLSIAQDAWITWYQGPSLSLHNYTLHNSGNGLYVFIIEGRVNKIDPQLKSPTLETLLGPRDALALYGINTPVQFQVGGNQAASFLIFEVPQG